MLKEFIAKRKAKGMLIQAFRSAELYQTYKSDNKIHYITPKIHSVRILNQPNRIEYVFTILNGMDPREVKKKEYVFKQVLGRTLEIKTDNIKKYTLTVYEKSLEKEITWDYEIIAPYAKKYLIPIVCGKDLNGQLVTYDLVTHPHTLVSGRTGSGKSSQLHNILMTIIKTKSPDDVHLYLSDLKVAEFAYYRGVKHVKHPICTKVKDTREMLKTLMPELDKRQNLIVKERVNHVKLLKKEIVPYIIVVIDEFASLRHDEEAMECLEELSNRGRALGIFLILSILRPDSKIIDSRLKNNLNVVMGFRCKDRINANVIGTPGAENLTNKGRFLLDLETMDGFPEIQALFLDAPKRLDKLLEPYINEFQIKDSNDHSDIIDAEFEVIEDEEEPVFGVLDDENS